MPVMNIKFQQLYTAITSSNKDITRPINRVLNDLQDGIHFVSKIFSTGTVTGIIHFAVAYSTGTGAVSNIMYSLKKRLVFLTPYLLILVVLKVEFAVRSYHALNSIFITGRYNIYFYIHI